MLSKAKELRYEMIKDAEGRSQNANCHAV